MYGLRLLDKFAKSAKTVGAVIGNYHPHGDQACYVSLIKMIHNKYPLIIGRGNCGTHIDIHAAYRYTEARLSDMYSELFKYIDIAEFTDNFDGTDKEPVFIPVLLPFLFLNGIFGVGFGEGNTASVPPHRISEILDAVQKRINGCSDEEVLACVVAPDYGASMGTIVSPKEDIAELYRTGFGTIKYMCTYEFSNIRKQQIFKVTSWVPNFSYDRFMTKCQGFVKEGYLDYVVSNSGGSRIELEVGYKDINAVYTKVIPLIHTYVTYNFRVLDSRTKELKTVNFIEYIDMWLDYRREQEIAFWESELTKKLVVFSKHQTVYNVYKNRSKIIKLLKMYSGKELTEQLKVYGDPTIIKAISLGELAKDNKEKLVGKMEEITAEISTIKGNLKNIDSVLLKYFSEISSKYEGPREMLLSNAVLPEATEMEQTYYVAISNSGKFTYDLKNKFANQSTFDYVFSSSGKFIVFYPNNIAKVYDVLKTKAIDIGFISIVSDNVEAIVVLDEAGNFLPLRNFCSSNSSTQTIFKDDRNISGVYGLSLSDTMVVSSSNKKSKARNKEYKVSELPLTRPRTKPKALLKWAGSNVKVKIVKGEVL